MTDKLDPLPWFAFNVGEYIVSTMRLTTLGHGVNLQFLMHYWQEGCLPEGDEAKIKLAQIDAAEWPRIKAVLIGRGDWLWTEDWMSPALDAARAMAEGWKERRLKRLRSLDERRPDPFEWSIIRLRIFKRDNFTCTYCGTRGGPLECDHMIPVCQGGSSDDDNLTTACFPCNREKGPRTVEQWRAA